MPSTAENMTWSMSFCIEVEDHCSLQSADANRVWYGVETNGRLVVLSGSAGNQLQFPESTSAECILKALIDNSTSEQA
eukprot:2754159-Amphidinium_carterae.1